MQLLCFFWCCCWEKLSVFWLAINSYTAIKFSRSRKRETHIVFCFQPDLKFVYRNHYNSVTICPLAITHQWGVPLNFVCDKHVKCIASVCLMKRMCCDGLAMPTFVHKFFTTLQKCLQIFLPKIEWNDGTKKEDSNPQQQWQQRQQWQTATPKKIHTPHENRTLNVC